MILCAFLLRFGTLESPSQPDTPRVPGAIGTPGGAQIRLLFFSLRQPKGLPMEISKHNLISYAGERDPACVLQGPQVHPALHGPGGPPGKTLAKCSSWLV